MISAGERRLLEGIVQHGTCSSEHLTILTGYKKSSRDTYLGKLRGRGFIVRQGEDWTATAEGRAFVGPFDTLPTGDELRLQYLETLPEGESTILAFVASRYPEAVTRDEISQVTDYKKSSRDTYLNKLVTRRLLERTSQSRIRASALLFDPEPVLS